jgi:outer membrane protein OmpA-like peptidoglycan-associated protein/tetratricopeptide (TPR) repeat protein
MPLRTIYLSICLLFTVCAFSQSPKKIVKQAKKDFKLKNYQASIDGYTKALELKSNDYNFTLARATAYEKLPDLSKAIIDYKQAISIKPKTKALYMKVADLSTSLNDYTTAAAHLDKFLLMDRKNIDALQKASYAYLNLKQFPVALEKANKALDAQKYNHLSHYYKALALDSMGEYGTANLEYASAIKLMKGLYAVGEKPASKFKPYYANHALILYRLTEYDASIKEYETATSLDLKDSVEPKQYKVFNLESQPYLKKTDFTNAVGYLNKSLALNPEFIDGFLARAAIYKQTSQFHSAISDYTKVVQLDKNNTKAYFGRAQCQLELGAYPEAIADLKQASQLQPNNLQIKNLLKEASDKNYKANKESDAPTFTINYPTVDNNGFANIYDNQQDILIEGQTKDKSFISEILINDKKADFNASEKNPAFTYKLSTNNLTKIDITVKDIYLNATTKTIKVGRIIDNTRVRVDFAGNVLSDDANKKPYANKNIYITNEKGELLYQTKTDDKGHFKFDKLPYDKKYLLSLEVDDASLTGITKFVVTDNNGNVILTSKMVEKGKFNFEIIPSDQNIMSLMTVNDEPVKIDIKGRLIASNSDRTPLASIKFLLLNEVNEVISFNVTDVDGNFSFQNLLPSGKYNFAIDVLDNNKIAFDKILVTDENGKIIKEITKNADGVFKFKFIESERAMMVTLAEDDFDPWVNLKFSNTKKEIEIIENIYYESGSYKILPAAELILAKTIEAMKKNPTLLLEVQSHTDATAGDEYNMDLSQKRANTVVDYLVSKGIDKKRLTAKGFGETQLTNKCANGVDCSDQEHRQNRRTVFKLSYP